MRTSETGKVSRMTFGLSLFFLISGVFVSCCIAFDTTRPEYYNFLWILPLVFGFFLSIYLLTSKNLSENNSTIAVIGVFFIRNIVTPFIMFIGSYSSMFSYLKQENVNRGIILMLYESIVIIIYASLKLPKISVQEKPELDCFYFSKRNEIVYFVVFAISILGIRFVRPDFFSGYTNILSQTDIRLKTASESAQGALYTLFTVLLPIAYLYIAVFLLKYVNKKIKMISAVKTLLNVAIICIPFFFMHNSDGFTLISIASLAFISYRLNGINKRALFIVFGIGGLGVFLYILLLISSLSFGAGNLTVNMQLSRSFQAYFPGVCNFAGYYNIGNYNKFETLFYDIYSAIPFRNSLFGVSGDKRLVILYTNDNAALSQIIPCVCQLHYYLWLFAPFVECLFVRGAIKAYHKSIHSSNIYSAYAYTMLFIYCTLTPIMYNMTIFLTRFLSTILPLLLFSCLFKKVIIPNSDTKIEINNIDNNLL